MDRKRDRDFTPKHFAIVFFGLLIVLLTFIGIMAWRGYVMVNMSTEYLLFGILIVSALIAGLAFLVKRIMFRAARIVAVVLGGLVIIVVAVVLLTFFTVMLNLNTPLHYSTLVSPEGKKVVVMREWGSDTELMDLRAADRWAADPEAKEGEFTEKDLGHSYFAAPRVLGMFYDTNAKSEGYLEIGALSAAELKHEWNGESLRLYIENPENGDAGETTLNLE